MIRTVSLCVIRRGEEILLEEFFDKTGNLTYYRPIGGTVEYGEPSKTTVIREVKEEIDADISEPKLIGIIENIFNYQNQIGHENDFIYEAELMNKSLYDMKEIDGIEGIKPFKAVWKPLNYFKGNSKVKLVPDGLLEPLQDRADERHIKHFSTQ